MSFLFLLSSFPTFKATDGIGMVPDLLTEASSDVMKQPFRFICPCHMWYQRQKAMQWRVLLLRYEDKQD